MLKNNKKAALAIMALIVLTVAPLFSLAQGQIQANSAQQIISITEKASLKLQDLITSVETNPETLAKIEAAGLAEQYANNVLLFSTSGLNSLDAAKDALAVNDYETAVDSAIDALEAIREVYRSIQIILDEAGVRLLQLTEGQGLLDAINRDLQRIERLTEILPNDTPQEIKDLLVTAEDKLNEAKTLLLEENLGEAKTAFIEAKQEIAQVYQYLKEEAQLSNEWRLNNYCQGLQERIRERLRYGREQGTDTAAILQSFGYQSETQLLESIQHRMQTTQGEQNFEKALQDCQEISQIIQQMEQTITQHINQQQGQSGAGGNGSGYGGNGGQR